MKLGACIKVSGSDEPIDAAIASILALPAKTITHLYVESANGRGTLKISKQDNRQLTDNQITVLDTGCMDQEELPPCEVIVFIPPECRFTPTGFRKLTRAMEDSRNTRITHYSVTSQSVLRDTHFWAGFLLVGFLLDWVWSAPWFNLPQDYHLRAIYIVTIGERRFLAQRRWFWRIWGLSEEMCIDGKSAVQIVSDDIVPYIKRHFYLLRWWSLLGNCALAGFYLAFYSALYAIYFFQVHTAVIGGTWTVIAIFIYWLIKNRIVGRAVFPLCTLWPLYVATFPGVAILVRFFG